MGTANDDGRHAAYDCRFGGDRVRLGTSRQNYGCHLYDHWHVRHADQYGDLFLGGDALNIGNGRRLPGMRQKDEIAWKNG